jgi:sulfoxide reductase heme-binding subunit YedZ
MQARSHESFGGWRLVGTISAAIGLGALVFAALDHFDAAGLRMSIRFTARTSVILFLLAFSASSLKRLWPSPMTQWLLRNRRYVGLSFAASHATHAVVIVAFAATAPAEFHEATSAATFIFGGIGYAFIAALTATSFDRTAAAIGPRPWKILHRTGVFYLWAQFSVSFVRHIDGTPIYWVFLGLLGLAMALRIAATLRPRSQLARAQPSQ